jgi:hypothetical protein
MAIVTLQSGGQLIINDKLRFTVYNWLDDQYGLMTVAGVVSSLTGLVYAGDVAHAYQSAIDAALQACMPIDAKLLGTRVTFLNRLAPRPLAGVATSTSTGSTANPALPTQVSGIISLRGDIASRHGRGRVYVPFPAVTDHDATLRPTAVYLGHLNALAAGMFSTVTFTSGVNTATVQIGIFDRRAGTLTTISSVHAKQVWATQRRRGDYGRKNPDSIPL